LTTPKNKRSRKVDVSADVVELLGAWWGECGKPEDDVLVFPGSRSGVFLHDGVIRNNFYEAMERPAFHEKGRRGRGEPFTHSGTPTRSERLRVVGRSFGSRAS
jgi:hypothetical protein